MAEIKTLIVIPAYNEEQMIARVIRDIPKKIKGAGKIQIVVIDDGSTDGTGSQAAKEGVKVLRHLINRGLGASLATGFSYALRKRVDIMVTFDADGQHRGKDIARLIQPIINEKADVVIGSRWKSRSMMPLTRQLVNWLSNIYTLVLFGIWTSDSQSGLRAFSKKALAKIQLRTQRMEVSSEIFKEIKRNKLTLAEVAIPAIYTPYSISKGQRIINASTVIWKLFLRHIR